MRPCEGRKFEARSSGACGRPVQAAAQAPAQSPEARAAALARAPPGGRPLGVRQPICRFLRKCSASFLCAARQNLPAARESARSGGGSGSRGSEKFWPRRKLGRSRLGPIVALLRAFCVPLQFRPDATCCAWPCAKCAKAAPILLDAARGQRSEPINCAHCGAAAEGQQLAAWRSRPAISMGRFYWPSDERASEKKEAPRFWQK